LCGIIEAFSQELPTGIYGGNVPTVFNFGTRELRSLPRNMVY